MLMQIDDWRGEPLEVAKSGGGVLAVVDPWRNVIRTGVRPWPAPELVQKIYQSRQSREFLEAEHTRAISVLGFYSDRQSLHSEDAITWSVFGPVAYATPAVRSAFVRALFSLIHIDDAPEHAHVWLWRRLPHPDTLVSGGPEIDFGIQTDRVFLLGEAKWRSSVGSAQGKNRDKDQVTLRQEFCRKYGRRVLPPVERFVVLGVSWKGGMVAPAETEADGVRLYTRDVMWDALAALEAHPCVKEVRAYVRWKTRNSLA